MKIKSLINRIEDVKENRFLYSTVNLNKTFLMENIYLKLKELLFVIFIIVVQFIIIELMKEIKYIFGFSFQKEKNEAEFINHNCHNDQDS